MQYFLVLFLEIIITGRGEVLKLKKSKIIFKIVILSEYGARSEQQPAEPVNQGSLS
jgi:hypothetical protein